MILVIPHQVGDLYLKTYKNDELLWRFRDYPRWPELTKTTKGLSGSQKRIEHKTTSGAQFDGPVQDAVGSSQIQR
jgi:hypothetical protein